MRLSSHRRSDLLCAAIVIAVVAVQWSLTMGLFSGAKITDPITYSSDSLFTGAAVAAGMRGEYFPFLSKQFPSLGAPFVASWNDFPGTDDWLFFGVGLMAKVLGVFGATNVSYLLACLFAGLALFVVARRFHLSRPFSTMAGILYGLSGYIVVRGTVHFSLTMYWIIPFQVLTASWLASRHGIPFRSKKFVATMVVGVITGWSFVYYAFFAMQLYGLALLVRMGRPKRLQPLGVAAALAGVTLAALVSMSLDTILYARANGVNQAATFRSPTDVEMYALKPLSLLVPGHQHKWEFFRHLADRAGEQAMIQGEIPAPYLGVVPNLMLLGLVVAAAMAIASRTMNLSVTWAFTVCWFIIGHVVGGENSIMGLGGVRLLRSVNRVSIVILTFVLLFGAWALTKVLRKAPVAAQWAVALALGIFGTYEAVPTVVTPESIAANHRVIESDRNLVVSAEAQLPKGSAVFELPVMDFPEVPAFAGVGAYELYRPYFYAKDLRFSHGDVKGRPNAGWKFRVGSLPPAAMMAELKQNGFASIYINLKGFPGREQGVIDAFVSSGAHVIATAELGDSVFLGI